MTNHTDPPPDIAASEQRAAAEAVAAAAPLQRQLDRLRAEIARRKQADSNRLAHELRQTLADLDHPNLLPVVRERLQRLTEHVERLAAPVEVDASTELTASFGLEPDQEIRVQAARAIGWRSPGDTDMPEYHDWWWSELDRLVDWIRTGERPS